MLDEEKCANCYWQQQCDKDIYLTYVIDKSDCDWYFPMVELDDDYIDEFIERQRMKWSELWPNYISEYSDGGLKD